MGRKEELVKKHGVSLKNNILHIDDNDISISGYQLNSVIGNGANAIIVKATGDIAKEPVAIKIWMKNKSKKDDGKDGRRPCGEQRGLRPLSILYG